MQETKLFTLLPENYVSTPDGMAIDSEGNLIVACPNFANIKMPGCLIKINKKKEIEKWVNVPIHPETKCARPMGIAFGPDGDIYICDNQGWSGDSELMYKGRMLRLRIKNNTIIKTTVIAEGMEHPNGIRIKGEYLYVTQSLLSKVKDPSGLMVSCVYRFHLEDKNIKVKNILEDKNIITTFLTHNPVMQYGADGIEFDKDDNLIVGNFGDGALHKIIFGKNGSVKENIVWAKDSGQLKSTDGMAIDKKGNLYVADFSANAIAKVTPNGEINRIAQSPDTDGFNGELDQPGEPCIWENKIVITCFDLVTDDDKINSKHEMPATMSQIELE